MLYVSSEYVRKCQSVFETENYTFYKRRARKLNREKDIKQGSGRMIFFSTFFDPTVHNGACSTISGIVGASKEQAGALQQNATCKYSDLNC
jgi:hypothetical protein